MKLAKLIVPPVLVLVIIATGFEAYIRLAKVPEYLLPTPTAIVRSITGDWRNLSVSLGKTAAAAGVGFAASALLGVIAALLLSSAGWIRRAFMPYTIFFQTVPIIAIAPLLLIWFGAGFQSVVISAFIVSVFPVIANTLTGLLSTDPALRDLFQLYGAGKMATMWKLKLPSALPNIITGLRIAAGLAVIGTIAGEFFAGSYDENPGLGVVMIAEKNTGETDHVFAVVLVASLLGLAMLCLVNLMGFLMLRRWHTSAQEQR